jgi:hypothetical protein
MRTHVQYIFWKESLNFSPLKLLFERRGGPPSSKVRVLLPYPMLIAGEGEYEYWRWEYDSRQQGRERTALLQKPIPIADFPQLK